MIPYVACVSVDVVIHYDYLKVCNKSCWHLAVQSDCAKVQTYAEAAEAAEHIRATVVQTIKIEFFPLPSFYNVLRLTESVLLSAG